MDLSAIGVIGEAISASDLCGKRVLLRLDLNVPLSAAGSVEDDERLRSALPTLAFLRAAGSRIIILSHLGRPHGVRVESLSLLPVRDALEGLVGVEIPFITDCLGAEACMLSERLMDGEIGMLENLRFHAQEEANDGDFAVSLSSLGDIYVNDGFSVSHRAHASLAAITEHLPSYAGLSLAAELRHLGLVCSSPRRPLALVIGGAKISTKINVIENLLDRIDYLIIGGAMANNFLHAGGIFMGRSLLESDVGEVVERILSACSERGIEVILPTDAIVSDSLSAGDKSREVAIDALASADMVLDIGSDTVARIKGVFDGCGTILWNGPLGAFEHAPFGEGSFACMRYAASLGKEGGGVSVIGGGGDTCLALKLAGVYGDFSYVSTGGGAFLEYLEGRELPGLAGLRLNSLHSG